MKPSDFASIYPWDSVFQNAECENSICCIMNYLAETGDEFRPLTFEEYQKKQSGADRDRFNKVIKYCKNEDTAKRVSSSWEKGLNK